MTMDEISRAVLGYARLLVYAHLRVVDSVQDHIRDRTSAGAWDQAWTGVRAREWFLLCNQITKQVIHGHGIA